LAARSTVPGFGNTKMNGNTETRIWREKLVKMYHHGR
jgi:hypothetical protein